MKVTGKIKVRSCTDWPNVNERNWEAVFKGSSASCPSPIAPGSLGSRTRRLRCRYRHERAAPPTWQSSHRGLGLSLTTQTTGSSPGWIVAPIAAVGRCPLPAVLCMPSSRRSVTAISDPGNRGASLRSCAANGPGARPCPASDRAGRHPSKEVFQNLGTVTANDSAPGVVSLPQVEWGTPA